MGCLTREYMPVAFKEAAVCFRVLRPEVPAGTNPTVRTLTASPRQATARHTPSQAAGPG